MSRIERGNTVEGAIRQLGDARHYGENTFIHKQDVTNRSGTKVFSDVKRRVDRQKKGTPLGRLSGAPLRTGNETHSAILDLFRTKHISPLYDDGLGEDNDFNVSLTVNRQVNKPGPLLDPIQPHELAILFKVNECNLNTCKPEADRFTVQANPLDIVPPSVYNYATALLQQLHAKQNPAEYKKTTPFDYWKDYSIDGIASHIAPFQNRSSVFAFGASLVDGRAVSTQCAVTALASMEARAEIECINYWGPGIKVGSHLYAIIKKFEQGDYSHEYLLGNKKVLTDHTGKRLANSNDCDNNPMRPYQLAFFALPDGGPIPMEISRYYDDDGYLRTDAHIIRIGTVMEIPLGHQYKETGTRLKPFTGTIPPCTMSHYTMTKNYMPVNHNPIKIHLKPNDGVLPL
jgi:hypothetical protein